jgi:hypothetical protein
LASTWWRARGLQQPVNRAGDGAAIAPAVQVRHQAQRLRHGLEFLRQRLRQIAERMQVADLVTETQQRGIGNREQRALERRE